MTIDKVYRILAKVGIDAELKMEAPSGGLVQVRTAESTGNLRVRCSEGSAVWDLFRLANALGTTQFNLKGLRRLRSPLVQTVEVTIGDDPLLTWHPEKFPRVHSLRTLFKVLRDRD
ncbi:hypothetical protein [Lewinella sp. 4G2]|uniref:hypothetical protein n=1 Tax=Lewinella sp. 4G2 TaxID=1803372 RepID=UPI0007B4E6AC|nr:hypothetical protein [Lewinella sp. 4G2]OAV45604.1 hypothetical protein A3850_014375 [Lewinella sp. 4G2]